MVSGMGGYTSKCEKKSKSLHLINHAASKLSRFPVNVGARETGLLMFTHREEPSQEATDKVYTSMDNKQNFEKSKYCLIFVLDVGVQSLCYKTRISTVP